MSSSRQFIYPVSGKMACQILQLAYEEQPGRMQWMLVSSSEGSSLYRLIDKDGIANVIQLPYLDYLKLNQNDQLSNEDYTKFKIAEDEKLFQRALAHMTGSDDSFKGLVTYCSSSPTPAESALDLSYVNNLNSNPATFFHSPITPEEQAQIARISGHNGNLNP